MKCLRFLLLTFADILSIFSNSYAFKIVGPGHPACKIHRRIYWLCLRTFTLDTQCHLYNSSGSLKVKARYVSVNDKAIAA